MTDQKPEHALPDQRLQRRQIFVSMERGFVQGASSPPERAAKKWKPVFREKVREMKDH
jgi:hypothetical protein